MSPFTRVLAARLIAAQSDAYGHKEITLEAAGKNIEAIITQMLPWGHRYDARQLFYDIIQESVPDTDDPFNIGGIVYLASIETEERLGLRLPSHMGESL